MANTGEIREFKLPRWEELPSIDLYLEQVLSLLEDWLKDWLSFDEKKIMTKTMVNNYVKQRVVPAPRRRRYTRRHVATLTFVCAFKRVFSINEIKALYEACIDEGVNVASAYDELAGALEQAVAQRFEGEGALATPRVTLVGASGAEVAPGISRVMAAGVEAVADKVFVERSL